MIDREYLLSFNCLDELTHALELNKPLVLAMLDQDAWTLLTVARSWEVAWEAEPSDGGMGLKGYEGQPFGPEAKPFTLEALQRVFTALASIHFCPCREMDRETIGRDEVASRLGVFVEKDLEYTKDHALLLSKAEAWKAAAKPTKLLLESKSASDKWTDWIRLAKHAEAVPAPTEVQEEFVLASRMMYAKISRLWKISVVVVMIAICLLAVAAVSMAIAVQKQHLEAERQTKIALAQKNIAVRQQKIAASLLLASNTNPKVTTVARAVLAASDIARNISYPAIVAPALLETLDNLISLPYWFSDVKAHDDEVRSVSFSPDGLMLASGSADHYVTITAIPSRTYVGKPVLPDFFMGTRLDCGGEVNHVAWSPDGTLVAAACNADVMVPGSTNHVRLWRLSDSGSCWSHAVDLVPQGSEQGQINAVAWSPESDFLATGSENNANLIWDVAAALSSAEKPWHYALDYGANVIVTKIRTIAWSPDGSVIVVGDQDAHGYVWLMSSGEPELIAVTDSDVGDINRVAISPDGTRFAAASDNQLVSVFNITEAVNGYVRGSNITVLKALHVLPPHGHEVSGVSWSATGDLASCAKDSTGMNGKHIRNL